MKKLLAFAGAATAVLAQIAPAGAQLASQSTQFQGSVGDICNVADPVNATTPMSYNNGVLQGETNAFSFQSNTAPNLQLRAVQVDYAPTGNNASYELQLKDEDQNQYILTSTPANASGWWSYDQPLTSNDKYRMRLRVTAPTGQILSAGYYAVTATTDCIVS